MLFNRKPCVPISLAVPRHSPISTGQQIPLILPQISYWYQHPQRLAKRVSQLSKSYLRTKLTYIAVIGMQHPAIHSEGEHNVISHVHCVDEGNRCRISAFRALVGSFMSKLSVRSKRSDRSDGPSK